MALYFDFIFTDHHSLPNNVWTKQWVHFWENVYLIKQLNKWTRLACLQSRENYLLNSVFPKTVLLIGDFLVVLVNFLSWLFNNYNRDLGLVALINNNKNSAQSSSLDRRPERPNKPQACRTSGPVYFRCWTIGAWLFVGRKPDWPCLFTSRCFCNIFQLYDD